MQNPASPITEVAVTLCLKMRLAKFGAHAHQLTPLALLAEFAPGVYSEQQLAPLAVLGLSRSLGLLTGRVINDTGETPGFYALSSVPPLRVAKGGQTMSSTGFLTAVVPALLHLLGPKKLWAPSKLRIPLVPTAPAAKNPTFYSTSALPVASALPVTTLRLVDEKSYSAQRANLDAPDSEPTVRVMVPNRLVYRLKLLGSLAVRLAPLVLLADFAPGTYSEQELTSLVGVDLARSLDILNGVSLRYKREKKGDYQLMAIPTRGSTKKKISYSSVSFPARILPIFQGLLLTHGYPPIRTKAVILDQSSGRLELRTHYAPAVDHGALRALKNEEPTADKQLDSALPTGGDAYAADHLGEAQVVETYEDLTAAEVAALVGLLAPAEVAAPLEVAAPVEELQPTSSPYLVNPTVVSVLGRPVEAALPQVYSVVGPAGLVMRNERMLVLSYEDAQLVAHAQFIQHGGWYVVMRAVWSVDETPALSPA